MIKIGTSGFSFDDWVGPVYPPRLNKSDWLGYYERALGFKALEINFTYYTLPSLRSMDALSRKTSQGFEFAVKAFRGMTHEIRDKRGGGWVDNRETFEKFRYSLNPLVRDGKLACVLAQFPYSFLPGQESLAYLKEFKNRLKDIPVVVEFRNRAWTREQTFSFLQENLLGYCVVDEPKLGKLMPFHPRATSEVGYFRFHGRNPRWFNVPTSVRYDYLYSEEELRELIPPIKTVASGTEKALVFFNNCHAGQAARNGIMLTQLLES
jgi:uncharacterized protein YecE (DUF72 family)